LSVLTIGELYKGISKLPDSKRRRSLLKWVEGDLKERFKGLPVIDSLIAATAIEENLTVVTRNTKDIESSGAMLINPWE